MAGQTEAMPANGAFSSRSWLYRKGLYGWLVFAVALGAAARILLLVTTPRLIRWDEPAFLLGRNFWNGLGYTMGGWPDVHYPPLFPLLVGGMERLIPALGPEGPSNLLYVVCGAVLALPVYGLTRRTLSRKAGGAAAVASVSLPWMLTGPLYWGTMTEPLYLLLLASLFLLSWHGLTTGSLAAYALAGVMISLAYLLRSEGVAYLLWLWFVHFIWRLLQGRLLRPSTWGQATLPLVTFVVVSAPYLLFLHNETGHWMLSGKPGLTWEIGTAILHEDPAEYDAVGASLDSSGERLMWYSPERFEKSILEHVREDPREFLWRLRRNFFLLRRDVLSTEMVPLWMATGVVLGWLYRRWDVEHLRGQLFIASTLLPLSGFLLFHIEQRFFAPLFLPLALWVGQGVAAVASWLQSTGAHLVPRWSEQVAWQRLSLVLSLCLLLLASAWTARAIVQHEAPRLPLVHKTAGLWLREHTAPEAAIMTRNAAINVYAYRGWVPFPFTEELETALEFGRGQGATHLVADEWELTRARPHLAYLLEDDHVRGLRRIASIPAPRGRTTYIWELH